MQKTLLVVLLAVALLISGCKSGSSGGAQQSTAYEQQRAEAERARAEAEARNRPQIEWVAANLNNHRFDNETSTNGIHQTRHETVSASVDTPCSLRVSDQFDNTLSTPGWDMSFRTECSIKLRSLPASGVTLESSRSETRVTFKDDTAVDCRQTIKSHPSEHQDSLTLYFSNRHEAEQFVAGFRKMASENCSSTPTGANRGEERQATTISTNAEKDTDDSRRQHEPIQAANHYCKVFSPSRTNDGREMYVLVTVFPNGTKLGVSLQAQQPGQISTTQKLWESVFTEDSRTGLWYSYFAPPNETVKSGMLTVNLRNPKELALEVNAPRRDGGLSKQDFSATCSTTPQ